MTLRIILLHKLHNFSGTHVALCIVTVKKGGGVFIFVKDHMSFIRLNEYCHSESFLESVGIHILKL